MPRITETARHEAAHIQMAWRCGLRIYEVDVVKGYSLIDLPRPMRCAKEYVQERRGGLGADAGIGFQYVVAVALAPGLHDTSVQDESRLIPYMRRFTGSTEAWWNLVTSAYEWGQDYLHCMADAVQRLAELLLRHGRVDDAESIQWLIHHASHEAGSILCQVYCGID